MKNIRLVLVAVLFSCSAFSAFGASESKGAADAAETMVTDIRIPGDTYAPLLHVISCMRNKTDYDRPVSYLALRNTLFPAIAARFPNPGEDFTFEEKFIAHFLQRTQEPFNRKRAGGIPYSLTFDGITHTLKTCACLRFTFEYRLIITLFQINALLEQFPPERTPVIVHTSFGAGELLQLYMLTLGLTMAGYNTIELNVLELPENKAKVDTASLLFQLPNAGKILKKMALDIAAIGPSNLPSTDRPDLQRAYSSEALSSEGKSPAIRLNKFLSGSVCDYISSSTMSCTQVHSYDFIDIEGGKSVHDEFIHILLAANFPSATSGAGVSVAFGSPWTDVATSGMNQITRYERVIKRNNLDMALSSFGGEFSIGLTNLDRHKNNIHRFLYGKDRRSQKAFSGDALSDYAESFVVGDYATLYGLKTVLAHFYAQYNHVAAPADGVELPAIEIDKSYNMAIELLALALEQACKITEYLEANLGFAVTSAEYMEKIFANTTPDFIHTSSSEGRVKKLYDWFMNALVLQVTTPENSTKKAKEYVSFSLIRSTNPTQEAITTFLQQVKIRGVASPVIYIKYDGAVYKVKRDVEPKAAGGGGGGSGGSD